ncbi:MAG: hypothetical protein ABFS56_09625 [Pseudomonadota bacterium]
METQLKNLKTIEDLQTLLVETIGFEETDERVFFPEEKQNLQAEYPQALKLAELFYFSVLVLPVAQLRRYKNVIPLPSTFLLIYQNNYGIGYFPNRIKLLIKKYYAVWKLALMNACIRYDY